jgi:hypothetical protein
MRDVGLLSTLWRAFGVLPPPEAANVMCARIPDCGFGVVSTTKLRRGNVLFRVPLDSALTVARSPNDDVDLALALLRAIEIDEAWRGYASAVLPSPDELTASFLWPRRLISELQDEVAIREAERCALRIGIMQRTLARRGRSAVGYSGDEAFYDSVPPLALPAAAAGWRLGNAEWGDNVGGTVTGPDGGSGHSNGGAVGPDGDIFIWALAVVLSRSILLHDASGEPMRALVPMADLFNHLPESPAEYVAAADAAGEEDPPPCWEIEEFSTPNYTDEQRTDDSSRWDAGIPPLRYNEEQMQQEASDTDTRGGGAVVEGPTPLGLTAGAFVVVRAPHDIPEGQQVLLPYGVETDAKLLATHGFIPISNSAQYVPLFRTVEAMAGAAAVFAAEVGWEAWKAERHARSSQPRIQEGERNEDSGSEGPSLKGNGRPHAGEELSTEEEDERGPLLQEKGRPPPPLAALGERLDRFPSLDASEAPIAAPPEEDLQACVKENGRPQPSLAALGEVPTEYMKDERLDLFMSLDASAAPLAARPGADLQACAHVVGAAMLLAARPEEVCWFGERWSHAAGHAVLTVAVGRLAGGGGGNSGGGLSGGGKPCGGRFGDGRSDGGIPAGGSSGGGMSEGGTPSGGMSSASMPVRDMSATRARELEGCACAFLGHAASAQLERLTAQSTAEEDAAAASALEARLRLVEGLWVADSVEREGGDPVAEDAEDAKVAAAAAALDARLRPAQLRLVGMQETDGADSGVGESILDSRRMLLALRYREGVKRLLGSFVQRCEARCAELGVVDELVA